MFVNNSLGTLLYVIFHVNNSCCYLRFNRPKNATSKGWLKRVVSPGKQTNLMAFSWARFNTFGEKWHDKLSPTSTLVPGSFATWWKNEHSDQSSNASQSNQPVFCPVVSSLWRTASDPWVPELVSTLSWYFILLLNMLFLERYLMEGYWPLCSRNDWEMSPLSRNQLEL